MMEAHIRSLRLKNNVSLLLACIGLLGAIVSWVAP